MSSYKKKEQDLIKSIKYYNNVNQIEKLRNELHMLTANKDMLDLEVVRKSQELDRVLNKYQNSKMSAYKKEK